MNANKEAREDSSERPAAAVSPKWRDPVIEAYKKDVDRTLLRENLKLTVEQRIRKAESFHASIAGWRGAKRIRTETKT